MKTEIRWCGDIGQFAIDRPIDDIQLEDGTIIKGSCDHRTKFCDETCFNVKLYKLYTLENKDVRNELYYHYILKHPHIFIKHLKQKRKQIARFRFMTRGEAFKNTDEIWQVYGLLLLALKELPDTIFWIPTRAWRDEACRGLLETLIKPMSNVRLHASTDPTTPTGPSGWSTMFYGDNEATHGRYLCPKTHHKAKGFCDRCVKGCFKDDDNTHIHFKQH